MKWLRNGSAALLLGLSVNAVAADDTAAEALSARWMAAYNSGDLKTLAAIYAKDALVQHGYCPTVRGRDAIETFWTGDVAAGGSQTQLFILDSFELDDLVYVSGSYAVDDPHADADDGPVGGSFTQIWRREGRAQWTLYRESWINLACVEAQPQQESPDERGGAGPRIAL